MTRARREKASIRSRIAAASVLALVATGMLAFVAHAISKCSHSACVGLHVFVLPLVALLALVAAASGWSMTSPHPALRWVARIVGGLALIAELLIFLLFATLGM